MTDPKQPAPRKPAAKKAVDDKSQMEAVRSLMATGLDFTPHVIDAGDGIEWAFKPDPGPADTDRMREAMNELNLAQEALQAGDLTVKLQPAFDALMDAIRDRLISDEDKASFPQPTYGINAAMFFSLHLTYGRSGFPTE